MIRCVWSSRVIPLRGGCASAAAGHRTAETFTGPGPWLDIHYPTFCCEISRLGPHLATLGRTWHGGRRGTCRISNRLEKALRVHEISLENLVSGWALVVISYGRTPTMRTMDWKWHGYVSGTGLGALLRPPATALVRWTAQTPCGRAARHHAASGSVLCTQYVCGRDVSVRPLAACR